MQLSQTLKRLLSRAIFGPKYGFPHRVASFVIRWNVCSGNLEVRHQIMDRFKTTVVGAIVCRSLFVLFLVCLSCWSNQSVAAVISGPIKNPATGNTYYLLSQNNWTQSQAEAVTLGGNLVTINDLDENNWVVSQFSNFGNVARALWIGLNDAQTEGVFVWASGEQVSYRNWGPGEPNNHLGVEDWVHIFPSSDSRFRRWNDAPNQANAFGFIMNGVVEVKPVPEPSTLLIGLGLVGPQLLRIRKTCGLNLRRKVRTNY
jgi:hypothetical protein